jgi:hypothetical protein
VHGLEVKRGADALLGLVSQDLTDHPAFFRDLPAVVIGVDLELSGDFLQLGDGQAVQHRAFELEHGVCGNEVLNDRSGRNLGGVGVMRQFQAFPTGSGFGWCLRDDGGR